MLAVVSFAVELVKDQATATNAPPDYAPPDLEIRALDHVQTSSKT